jgi:N-methylhydantoinase B
MNTDSAILSNPGSGSASSAGGSPAEIDPITFSVVLSRFSAIATEMTLTLERSAWTSILALARDFSCAIYDTVPRQVAMQDGLPIHTTSMQLLVGSIAKAFEGDVYEGDVFLSNDPYSGNTHVGDLVAAAPVFADGELRFWSVAKAHQMDTGAFVPSSVTAQSQNIWQEGLQIPPVRLIQRGKVRKDLWALYLANMRYSELLEGDLWAQLGSIEKGRQRIVELCDEISTAEVMRYVDAILAYSDRRMSQEISAMPDGEYFGEGWVDSDGIEAEHIPIKVKVTIAGDQATVDYSESGPQAKGGANATYASAMAAGTVPFMYYIDPDIPHNQGCIGHVDVIAKEGTICNARHPASTSCATVVPADMMQDVINKAMVEAIPDRVIAGSCRSANIPQFAGDEDERGQAWGVMLFTTTGASGAARETDGWPLLESQAALGGLKVQSIEQMELLYPIMIEQNEVEPCSMGYGEWIGGPGIRASVKGLRGEMVAITFGDGCANPPHGALGGTPGIGGGQWVEDLETGHRRFISAAGNIEMERDKHLWVGVSTGGGGYGNPHDRDPEAVRLDARDELITREVAREVFGVALSDDADPQIDEEATRRRRDELRAVERPVLDPVEPNAATWVADNMSEGDVYLLNPMI